MFLRSQRFLPINAVIRVLIELPDGGGEIKAIARVAFVRDLAAAAADAKPSGMGIEFLDLQGPQLDRISQFIAERTTAEADRSGPVQLHRRLRVLVVEDDDAYRDVTSTVFRERGHEVRTAGDGLEALGMCLKDPPDLIVSDVQMPRMDGWQLLRILRARPTLSTVPVVFLTTLGGEDERLRGYQLGVDDYVGKPYVADELVARAERVIMRSGPGNVVERKSLRGGLDQVSLGSVLSFLEVERKSGVLLVVGSDEGEPSSARFFIQEGRPLRVEIDGRTRTSHQAACDVLGWRTGQFEFAAQEVVCADDLHTSTTGLLLEAARLRDEGSRG
jgi:DNA-binding response OmpR family regulator